MARLDQCGRFGKRTVPLQSCLQPLEVNSARDLVGAEFGEMRSRPLRVKQGEPPAAKPLNQSVQGDLRSIGDLVKHGLPEKSSADGHAIQPTDEFPVLPGLDAMGDPLTVKVR